MMRKRRPWTAALMGLLLTLALVTATPADADTPETATAAGQLQVRMINPFFEGIAVKPPTVTYFNWQKQERLTLSGLNWQSWGGPQAVALGQNDQGDQTEVTLSAKRRCGLATMRFYTRLIVNGATFRLPCKVQVLSGSDIGTGAEDVSAYAQPARKYIYVGSNKASLMEGKWQHLGRPNATATGVAISWWNGTDWHWVGSRLALSRIGYCPQVGSLVYYKTQLTTYGSGVATGSMPIKRAARQLRKQVGKASPRHRVQYNYRKWCKRKRYPMDYWVPWQ
jgi:hypothetical protein